MNMKMKIIFRTLAMTFIFSSVMACATSGSKEGFAQDLSNFQRISFNISGDLYLSQGNAYVVKIEASEEDKAEIIARVEGNTLVIKTKSNWKNLNDVKVYVTMPVIEGIDLAGSGNIYAPSEIKVASIDLSLSGSGNMSFDKLQAENTHTSIAGSGNITVKGKSAESLSVNIAGSGDVNVADVESKNVKVDISGSGSAKVYATENLNTNIVGSGSVFYKGKPLVNANSVGSGSTKPL
jgi:carbon monoxide dehydrogenase subunit G